MAAKCQATIDYLLLERDNHPEWIAVIAFYKALHLVETLFAHDKASHSRNHESRESLLKSDRRYKNIWEHYRVLWTISTVARYLSSVESFAEYMSPEDVEKEVIRHRLNQVEKSVAKLVGAT